METQFSSRGFQIVGDLRRILNVLDDHHGAERQQIYELLAAHLRSASPMALLGGAADVEPVSQARIPLKAGSVEVSSDEGEIVLYVVDASGRDVGVGMSQAQAVELRSVLGRVR